VFDGGFGVYGSLFGLFCLVAEVLLIAGNSPGTCNFLGNSWGASLPASIALAASAFAVICSTILKLVGDKMQVE
jgi:hypothetical protein